MVLQTQRDGVNESRGTVAEFDNLTWMEGEDSLMQSSEVDEMLAIGDQEGQFAGTACCAGSVTVQPSSQDVMLGKGKSDQVRNAACYALRLS